MFPCALEEMVFPSAAAAAASAPAPVPAAAAGGAASSAAGTLAVAGAHGKKHAAPKQALDGLYYTVSQAASLKRNQPQVRCRGPWLARWRAPRDRRQAASQT
jgi:hypothetical protein